MYRYLALIWNPSDERSRLAVIALNERLARQPGPWARALDEAGVTILHAGRSPGSSDTLPLAHAAGAVFVWQRATLDAVGSDRHRAQHAH